MGKEILREAAVAGRFYPAERKKLEAFLSDACPKGAPEKKVRAIFAPHAGYVYSGFSAAEVYRRIKVPDVVVVLCPNHTGRGRKISVWPSGVWQTPIGEVPVQQQLADQILKEAGERGDTAAHEFEHAIEVHLPFLLWKNPKVEIVPIVLGGISPERVAEVGALLSSVVGEDQLIVSSTDMSHYISAQAAKKQDEPALEMIRQVNSQGLYNTVVENDISMCGFIPTAVMLEAASQWKLKKGELLDYRNSGDVTGDHSSVVSYAAGWIV